MQAIRSWSGETSFFFREVTVAWTEAYGQGCVHDAIHWFLHKFNYWPCWYSPSIQSCSPLDVPCHCSFTQPNSCGHSPFLMRTSSWMARLDCATGSSQPTSSCSCGRSLEAQWQHGRSGCQESRLVETEWGQSVTLGRCSEDGSSRPAFFCGCCASFLLTLSRLFRSAAGCIQDYAETSVMLHYNYRRDNNVDVFEFTHSWHNFNYWLTPTHQTTVEVTLRAIINQTQHQAAHSWLNKHSPWTAYFFVQFYIWVTGLKIVFELEIEL